jgi:hypothetical protein
MQTLSEALQAASSKFKPALVPEQCSLQYNKKPVDLHTPFRLLNVSAGSKLEVLIHSECSLQHRSIGIIEKCHDTIALDSGRPGLQCNWTEAVTT